MPGYHEHLEAEGDLAIDLTADEEDELAHDDTVSRDRVSSAGNGGQPSVRKPRPPTSAPAPSASTSRPRSSSMSNKPQSARQASSNATSANAPGSPSPQRVGPSEEIVQTCPVCSKSIETDNDGLNAHIDFCLSRGAIMEAQAATSSSHDPRKPKSKASPVRKKGGGKDMGGGKRK